MYHYNDTILLIQWYDSITKVIKSYHYSDSINISLSFNEYIYIRTRISLYKVIRVKYGGNRYHNPQENNKKTIIPRWFLTSVFQPTNRPKKSGKYVHWPYRATAVTDNWRCCRLSATLSYWFSVSYSSVADVAVIRRPKGGKRLLRACPKNDKMF